MIPASGGVGGNGGSVTEIMDRIKTPAGRHVTVENHNDGWEDMSLGLEAPIIRAVTAGMPTTLVLPADELAMRAAR